MNWAIRSIADVEVQVTAVQRAHEYSILPSENHGKNGNSRLMVMAEMAMMVVMMVVVFNKLFLTGYICKIWF